MFKYLALVIIVFVSLLSTVSATIINIPDDYITVQLGINASSDGDTVLISPGIYYENLKYNGRLITLGSMYITTGDPSYIDSTIIDGLEALATVTFDQDEDSSAILIGLTIRNGESGHGGGVWCDSTSPTICYNKIINNLGTYGAGIACEYLDAHIHHNFIAGNVASQYGGGIYVNRCNPIISNNTIIENTADYGGAIRCLYSTPEILDNTIYLNRGNRGAGGISLNDSDPIITNTVLWADSNSNGVREIYGYNVHPEVSYCVIQNGYYSGDYIYDTDPLFCAPEIYDFSVNITSPCLGNGVDGSDIGAHGLGCDRETINIPEDYATIQGGINASADGDTILVQPGTYIENLNFQGKEILLISMYCIEGDTGFIHQTILEPEVDDPIITLESEESSEAKIIGFTLQNGCGHYGGGIYCSNNSNPTIDHNRFVNNNAFQGSGIYIHEASPTITNNYFYADTSEFDGGAITCLYSSSVISDNIFIDNWGDCGGAVYLSMADCIVANNMMIGNSCVHTGGAIGGRGDRSPIIENNIIMNNNATFGGGIGLARPNGIIRNNLIANNTATYGAGINLSYNDSVLVYNNTITNNHASQAGGGLYAYYSRAIITNTIFWGDSTANLSDEIHLADNCIAEITYSDIQGGWDGEGNIDADPRFCGPASDDYTIHFNSPCAGTGMDGEDIGAYGIGCYGGRLVVPSSYPTIQAAIDASPSDNDTILVEPGIYYENIDFNRHKIIVASMFLLTEDTTYITSTIIDGSDSGSVVTIENYADSTTGLYGFTIQNGAADLGGGVYIKNADVDIENNIIQNNSASSSFRNGGGIYTTQSNTNITDCIIRENNAEEGGGIYFSGHASEDIQGLIKNNTIYDNNADDGAGIRTTYYASPVIVNNKIYGNTNTGRGGGIYCSGTSMPEIQLNTITDNNGSGIFCAYQANAIIKENHIIRNLSGGIRCNNASPTIEKNIISENVAEYNGGGIYCHNNSNAIITSNLISKNVSFGGAYSSRGGGIYCYDSDLIIANNTICYNISDSAGLGIYCGDDTHPVITNTILWNDTTGEHENEIYRHYNSSITITYSNVLGGWEGEGNINAYPMFIDPENDDFNLLAGSPCIDAGDPDSPLDPDSTRADIGAFYFDQLVSIDENVELPVSFSLMQNYPNPFNARTIITYTLSEPSNVRIDIYDILGRRVITLVDEYKPSGVYQALWKASDKPSGVYFYKINAGDFTDSRNMMLIK